MNNASNLLFRLNQVFWVAVSIIWYAPQDLLSSLKVGNLLISGEVLMLLFFLLVLLSSFFILVFYMILILRQSKGQSVPRIIIFGCLSLFLFFIITSGNELLTYCSISILKALLVLVLISSILYFVLHYISYKIESLSDSAARFKKILKFVDIYCCFALNNYAWFFVFSILL